MPDSKTILVIGGGFTGLTAGIDAAEAGYDVVIVEKNPYLGGRVAQLNKYFPKLCPPLCGLEINMRRIKTNPNITFYTMAEVEKVSGVPGNYDVTIKIKPRYVNEKCTGCNACAEACPEERPDEFNFGLSKTRVAYLPFDQAFPFRYVIDDKYCKGNSCAKCKEACKYDAIDLDMKPEKVNIKAGAVILATGWNPYDANRIDNLGFGKVKNVITNMMMERLAAQNGPTRGKIIRPSDGRVPQTIGFVQCAGSRDENHLQFCSYICCMASLKQAMYLWEQNPEAKVYIFYIDIRTPGRYEQFYWKVKDNPNAVFIKGKVAKVAQADNDDVIVEAEDMISGELIRQRLDMLVLATGMEPAAKTARPSIHLNFNEHGFAMPDDTGILAAGCAKNPYDVAKSVQDATGAALKAIQRIVGGR
ncbi:MAG: CoB--CoM heterodisulfide reductase iron-sulfur subunit A family protein [Thermodesulfovibrionales bacterium]|nr:CoB--CoM heterodisulfide reductase iron-sulfur subunit A family protein [Thermodesulfovibrionales bacterium]